MSIEVEVKEGLATEANAERRLPTSYLLASWRSTTPVDDQAEQIGITLTNDQGEVVRYRLPLEGALQLGCSIAEYSADYLERVLSKYKSLSLTNASSEVVDELRAPREPYAKPVTAPQPGLSPVFCINCKFHVRKVKDIDRCTAPSVVKVDLVHGAYHPSCKEQRYNRREATCGADGKLFRQARADIVPGATNILARSNPPQH